MTYAVTAQQLLSNSCSDSVPAAVLVTDEQNLICSSIFASFGRDMLYYFHIGHLKSFLQLESDVEIRVDFYGIIVKFDVHVGKPFLL